MRRSGAAPSDMQRNESFLSDLGERLRRLDDPVAILGEAAAALGAHLGVNRAGYAEFDADARHFTVERDWTDGSVKHGTGKRATLSFGADVVAMLYRGETQCIVDAYVDPRVRRADLAAFVEMSIVAAVTVPLVKSGRLVAMLSVHQSRPRAWTAAEVALVEQVAERTWAALERARAEARAQDSQAQLRLLADNMAQLAWIAGADGAPHWYNRRWYDYSGATSDRMADEGWAGFVAPEAREDAQAQVARALETGDAFELVLPLRAADGRHRPFLVRVQPERGRDGGVLRWFGTGTDIADRMESERASAFLLALGDRTRRSTDPADVLSASIAALGRHLGASRVGYAEVEADGETIEVVHDWTDGSVASVAGRHSLRAFGEAHGAIVRAGETFRADDVAARIAAGDRAVFDAMRIAAAVTVPLVKQDRLVAVLSVHQREPRVWTEAEVQLIREVAERTWAALEWARAEAALRDTQRNRAFLLTLGDQVRGEADPTVVIAATNRALGEHLGALRVGYGEVDDTGERLTFTADWTDGVISNVGTFELAAFGEAIVAANRAGLTLSLSGAYTDAELRTPYCRIANPEFDCSTPEENFEQAPPGTRLPVTPKFKGNAQARYEWSPRAETDASVQGAVIYQSNTLLDLRETEREILSRQKGYATVDVAAGFDAAGFSVELYVRNLFDALGSNFRTAQCAIQTCGETLYSFPNQPRTIGLRVGRSF